MNDDNFINLVDPIIGGGKKINKSMLFFNEEDNQDDSYIVPAGLYYKSVTQCVNNKCKTIETTNNNDVADDDIIDVLHNLIFGKNESESGSVIDDTNTHNDESVNDVPIIKKNVTKKQINKNKNKNKTKKVKVKDK